MALLSPEEAICGRLKAVTAVTNVLSQRIFPQDATHDSTLPHAVYQRTDSETQQTLSASSRLTQYSIDVEVFAKTKTELHTAGVAVVGALQGWKDLTKGVQGCFHKSSTVQAESDEGVYSITHTFALWQKPVEAA